MPLPTHWTSLEYSLLPCEQQRQNGRVIEASCHWPGILWLGVVKMVAIAVGLGALLLRAAAAWHPTPHSKAPNATAGEELFERAVAAVRGCAARRSPPRGAVPHVASARFVEESVIWSTYKELPGGCVILDDRPGGAL